MRRIYLLIALVTLAMFSHPTPAFAHANLLRSNPAANASLEQAPSEIRLWFSEALEGSFSRFTLRDSQGAVIHTPASQVDAHDTTQLWMELSATTLAEGVYTVVWRVLSVDGHSTEGSFSFGVGVLVPINPNQNTLDETIPMPSAAIRFAYLLSLALFVGALGFGRFVWEPTRLQYGLDTAYQPRFWLIGAWFLLGITTILTLLLQVATAADISIGQAWADPALEAMLRDSRYGTLWLIRMGLWGLAGAFMYGILRGARRGLYEMALLAGAGMALCYGLYSHASAMSQDTAAAVGGDFLHLSSSVLWLGGLLQFGVILLLLRRRDTLSMAFWGDLTGRFSQMARLLTAVLLISGLYAAWLHVGSWAALTSTVYGRLLGAKILLMLPLFGLAAFNLVYTQRRLMAGQRVWLGYLRAAVMGEVTLMLGILALVGGMTAIAPARTVLAHQAESLSPTYPPLHLSQDLEALRVEVTVEPGYVGENQFKVALFDADGQAVTDATRIRMLFTHQTQALGQSELRPLLQDDGTYQISGATLSAVGEWQLRLMIQRPQRFDTLADFALTIKPMPTPQASTHEHRLPPGTQWLLMSLSGLAFLGMGAFGIGRFGVRNVGLLAGTVLLVGALFVWSSIRTFNGAFAVGRLEVQNAWVQPAAQGMTTGVYLTLENGGAADLRLVGAVTDAAETAEIHQSMVEDGVMMMRPVGGLAVPAGERVEIVAGTYHLMLLNLRQDLREGDEIKLTLRFENGAEVAVIVPVRFGAGE